MLMHALAAAPGNGRIRVVLCELIFRYQKVLSHFISLLLSKYT
jgi:hypothetical protein